MKACHVTITTTVDGVESSISRKGELALDLLSANLRYQEENARVALAWENQSLTIVREGDYTLRLYLKEGKITDGSIGLTGAEGAIQTQTYRLACSVQKQSFLLSAHYGLMIGGETQDMKIRLLAKEI